nr:4Fe-4S dicluster domain-containing protein [uncultured Holophaga sp.]
MEPIIQKAKELLESGAVQGILGHAQGTGDTRRPHFATTPAQADKLVTDGDCPTNLANLLMKHEVKHLGKLAIIAQKPSILRSLLQLKAERQVQEDSYIALVPDKEGSGFQELGTIQAMESYLAEIPRKVPKKDQAMMDKLMAMSRSERFAFWKQELSRCIKCYACRNSCPMCYCERCTMDCNRPQWVPVPSHAVGNQEYHLVRAMHLAGRCVECGECGRACPVGIPVHLLTIFGEESVRRQFGQGGGASSTLDFALSTFRPDDQESFIR